MTWAREKFIRRGVIRPGVAAGHGDPTPATWIDKPTLRLLGNEAATLAREHARRAEARRGREEERP